MENCYLLQMPIHAFWLDANVDINGLLLCYDVTWTYFYQFFAVFTGPFLFWYIYISYFRRLGECCICREECTVLANLSCQAALIRQKSRQTSVLTKIFHLAKSQGYGLELMTSGSLASLWCHLFSDDDEFSFFPTGDEEGIDILYPFRIFSWKKRDSCNKEKDKSEKSDVKVKEEKKGNSLITPCCNLCNGLSSSASSIYSYFTGNSSNNGEQGVQYSKWPWLKLLEEMATLTTDCSGHDNICEECMRRCIERQADQDCLPPRCPICLQMLYESDFMYLMVPNEKQMLRRSIHEYMERSVWQMLKVGWPSQAPSFLLVWALLSNSLPERVTNGVLCPEAPSNYAHSTPLDTSSRPFSNSNHLESFPFTCFQNPSLPNSNIVRSKSANGMDLFAASFKDRICNLSEKNKNKNSNRRCRSQTPNKPLDNQLESVNNREQVETILQRCFGMEAFPLKTVLVNRQMVLKYPSLHMEYIVRHLVWAYSVMYHPDNSNEEEHVLASQLMSQNNATPLVASSYLTNQYLRRFAMQCPGCGVFVQRQCGCRNVVCFYCHTRFVCTVMDDCFDAVFL